MFLQFGENGGVKLEKNDGNRGKSILTGKITALIILGFELLVLASHLFGNSWKSTENLILFIEDSSIFFNMICISFIVQAILAKPRSWFLFFLELINIVLINKLYSNKTWNQLWNFLKEHWLIVTIVSVGATVLIGLIIFLVRRYIRKKKNFPQQNTSDQKPENNIQATETVHYNSVNNNIRYPGKSKRIIRIKQTKIKSAKFSTNQPETKPILWVWKMLIYIVSGVSSILITDYILYQKLNLGLYRPAFLEQHTDILHILQYAGVIIVVVIFAILLGKAFISSFEKKQITPKGTALISLILEVLFFMFTNQINEMEFLDNFLDSISQNGFAAIMVWISVFLIIHIGCTILFGTIFSKKGGNSNRINEILSENILEIETKLVKFVCNLLKGIVTLFNFIPDFFNTIGVLLLDEDALFEVDISYEPKNKDEKDKPKTQENTEGKDQS